MSKLTPNQEKILTAASARRGGTILPLPGDVKLGASALKTTLASLVKRGFVIERGKNKKPAITKAGRTRRSLSVAAEPHLSRRDRR